MHRHRKKLLASLAVLALCASPLRAAAGPHETTEAQMAWTDWAGFRVFGGGADLRAARRSQGFWLQGGAGWRLDDAVALTASYRLMGYAWGNVLGTEAGDVDDRVGLPIVGLLVRF